MCQLSFPGRTLTLITVFKAPWRPLSFGGVVCVTVSCWPPLSFLFPFSVSYPLNSVLAMKKKSILSFYFRIFYILPLMFWFLSLILSLFITFQFVYNFIISILIFNFFKFCFHSLYFIFDLNFLWIFIFQFYPWIQSLMIFKIRLSMF